MIVRYYIYLILLSFVGVMGCSLRESQRSDAQATRSVSSLHSTMSILDSSATQRAIENKGWILEGWWPHNSSLAAVVVNKGDTIDARDAEMWIVRASDTGMQRIGNPVKLYNFPPTSIAWLSSKPDYQLLVLKLEYPTENVVMTDIFRIIGDSLSKTYTDPPKVCKAANIISPDNAENPMIVSYSSPDPWRGGCEFLCEELAEQVGAYPTWATVRRWSGNAWVVDSTSPRNFYRELSKKYDRVADSLAVRTDFQESCRGYIDVAGLRILAERARGIAK